MSCCDICKTQEHVMRYRRKDGKELHLCRNCAPMLADLVEGVCGICRYAHKGDTLYCMFGNQLCQKQPDDHCGRFYPVPLRRLGE